MADDGILIIEDVQSWKWIEILKKTVPEHLKPYIHVYDLRPIKNRYDDILFTIDKSKPPNIPPVKVSGPLKRKPPVNVAAPLKRKPPVNVAAPLKKNPPHPKLVIPKYQHPKIASPPIARRSWGIHHFI
jgi:hypothetical protein